MTVLKFRILAPVFFVCNTCTPVYFVCTPVPVYCVRGVEERDDLLLLSSSLSVQRALHGREG